MSLELKPSHNPSQRQHIKLKFLPIPIFGLGRPGPGTRPDEPEPDIEPEIPLPPRGTLSSVVILHRIHRLP